VVSSRKAVQCNALRLLKGRTRCLTS
jgi:hypothetical protein